MPLRPGNKNLLSGLSVAVLGGVVMMLFSDSLIHLPPNGGAIMTLKERADKMVKVLKEVEAQLIVIKERTRHIEHEVAQLFITMAKLNDDVS